MTKSEERQMHLSTKTRARLVAAAAAASAVLVVAGCGDDGNSASSASSGAGQAGKLTTVKIGIVPQAVSAMFPLGEQVGIYRKHGIDLQISTMASVGLLVPQAVSGEVQFIQNAPLGMIQAQSTGLTFSLMTQTSGYSPSDPGGVLVRPESGIKEPKDLNGKTICVSAVNSATQLNFESLIDQSGGSSKTVKFIAVPFPATVDAIKGGRCAAATLQEPFVSQGRKAGLVRVFSTASVLGSTGAPQTAVYGYTPWVKGNPDIAKRFVDATVESIRYALKHPKEVRSVLPALTGITPQIAATTHTPFLYYQVQKQALQRIADRALKYGFIKKQVDTSEAVWSGAPVAEGL
jgi:NitT/TauT family transport system substrate-binding protein